VASISASASSTPRSWGRKRGRIGGKDQERAKGTKLKMALADACGLALCVWAASASAHEVALVEETLDATFVFEKPERLIGDRAYVRLRPARRPVARVGGIEMIAPHPSRTGKSPRRPKTGVSSGPTRGAGISSGCFRLARELAVPGDPLRAEGRELPRVREAGVHRHPPEVFVRWLLHGSLYRHAATFSSNSSTSFTGTPKICDTDRKLIAEVADEKWPGFVRCNNNHCFG
jgi:hypothetical protein